MNLLEERYRLVLRLLPASYRAEWEDEMVATFMEAAGEVSDEDNPKPRWSEILSVAALSVRVRLGGTDTSPRSVVWGNTVRLAALLGLLVLAAGSCASLVGFLRLYVSGPPPGLGIGYTEVLGPAGSAERVARVAGGLIGIAWIGAYVVLFYGHRRAAQTLAVLALAPVLYGAATSFVLGPSFGFSAVAGSMLAVVTVLALLAGFHRDAPTPVSRARWLAALPVGAGALLAVTLTALRLDSDVQLVVWTWLGMGGLHRMLFIAAGLTYLAVHAYAPTRRTPSWPLALTLLAAPVLVAQIVAVPFSLRATGQVAGTAVLVLGQIVAVVAVGLAMLITGTRALRQLPSGHGRVSLRCPPCRSRRSSSSG